MPWPATCPSPCCTVTSPETARAEGMNCVYIHALAPEDIVTGGRTRTQARTSRPQYRVEVTLMAGAMSEAHRQEIAALVTAAVIRASNRWAVTIADRPGHGDSDDQPGRTIPDWAADIAALADHLSLAPRLNLTLPRQVPGLAHFAFGGLTAGLLARWPQTVDHLRTLTAPPC
jgi:pimeloyl-ACP methyl ester carboxylesterase